MLNPTTVLHEKYPELSVDDGTLHMRCLQDYNFQEPRRFIWDNKLLTNSAVKTLNIRGVIQSIDTRLQLKQSDFDLNLLLNPKDCQKDPTKFSFVVLKSIQYVIQAGPLEQQLSSHHSNLPTINENENNNETVQNKENETKETENKENQIPFDAEKVNLELLTLKKNLIAELSEFENLQFKPFSGSVKKIEAEVTPVPLPQQTVVNNNLKENAKENVKEQKEVTETENEDLRESQYQNWNQKQLIHYVLMLEETNSQLQKQLKEEKEKHQQFVKETEPILKLRDRELKLPDIVRSEAKKGKFMGIW
ncbi:Conserved_hypothetical protein [Hexamita inflata]|uniref:Uncharacterized protein n=1 Tax=Hexamita inflata TaxID=28002 RepID=A0AA86R9N5_9EUKA|nr:Conserved hypothetical protein [Hexamita inflata]